MSTIFNNNTQDTANKYSFVCLAETIIVTTKHKLTLTHKSIKLTAIQHQYKIMQ